MNVKLPFQPLTLSLSGLALIGGVSAARAEPSQVKICEDVNEQVVIYRDYTPKSNYFYYVPKIRFKVDSKNRTLINEVESFTPEGAPATAFKFQIEPYFDGIRAKKACIREVLRKEQGLASIQQVPEPDLSPIEATQMTISLDEYGIKNESPIVTNRLYMKNPTNFRVVLSSERAAEFRTALNEGLGVNVDVTFAYKGVKVSGSARVDVSCIDVARQLNYKGEAKVKFTTAQVSGAIRDAAHKSNAQVVTRGDITAMGGMIDKVTNICFQALGNNNSGFGSSSATANWNSSSFLDDLRPGDEEKVNRFLRARRQELLIEKPPVASSYVRSWNTFENPIEMANFAFKQENWNRDDKGFFDQVHLVDSDASVTVGAILKAQMNKTAQGPINLGTARIKVVSEGRSYKQITKTGLKIGPNQKWTMKPRLLMKAMSRVSPADTKPVLYSWEDSWGTPGDALYYRIGDYGDWLPVGGLKEISTEPNESGELQFYTDRKQLFHMIDTDLTRDWKWYVVPVTPVFEIERFFPMFMVDMRGNRI